MRKEMIPAEYLANNDSYQFFEQLNQLFKTGPTRTNVMDLMCLLVDKRSHWCAKVS
jgi:glycerate 2-kinase